MGKLYFASATQPCATGIGAIRTESTRARGIRSSRVVSGRATSIGQVGAALREVAVSATPGSSVRLPKNVSSFEGSRPPISVFDGDDVDCWARPSAGVARRVNANIGRSRSGDMDMNV